MRARFSNADGVLRVIPEIPDVALAKLEGRNGIGKSLAARLLELISGEPPYASLPLAWRSLVEQLGEVTVHVDGLNGHELQVVMDSREWDPENQIAAVQNPGRVTVDGVVVGWEQARSLLQVRRIAGDETLSETIGLALNQTAKEVDGRRLEITGLTKRWSEAWSSFRLANDSAAEMGRRVFKELESLDADRQQLFELKEQASQHATQVAKALEILRSLERMAESESNLNSYERAWNRRRELAQSIARTEQELMQHRGPRGSDSQADFERLARILRLRRDAHTRAQFDKNAVLHALDLTSAPTSEEIRRLKAEAQRDQTQLRRELKSLFAAGTIRDTATVVARTLRELPSELHNEVVAELDHEITVGELSRGLERRRETLRDVPKTDAVILAERKLSKNADRLSLLDSLEPALRVAERKTSNLQDAERELEDFFQFSKAERAERERLSEGLEDDRNRLIDATGEALLALVNLRTAAGLESARDSALKISEDDNEDEQAEGALSSDGLDQRLVAPDALRKELLEVTSQKIATVQALRDVQLAKDWRDDLPHAIIEVGLQLDQQQKRQSDANNALRAIIEDREQCIYRLRISRSELLSFASSLLNDSHWGQIRPLAEVWLSRRGSSLNALRRLATNLESESDSIRPLSDELIALDLASEFEVLTRELEDAAALVRDQWGVATAFIRRESHDLAPRLVHHEMQSWQFAQLDESNRGRILKRWVESLVEGLLSQDVLRRELFEQTEAVEYDLATRSVIWKSQDGRRRRRPLEAFSSGEQVFAYTRAKLESLRTLSETAEYVLVFLDEFGAFVARDRFAQLVRYVQTDVLGTIADQVVVMLPSNDTASEFGARKLRAQFAREDYLVESLISKPEATR